METKQRKPGETLRVHFEPEQAEHLRGAAQATGMSAPDLVRAAVYAFMNAMVTIEVHSPGRTDMVTSMHGYCIVEGAMPPEHPSETPLV